MSNIKSVASQFLDKAKINSSSLAIQSRPANAFQSIFEVQKLEEHEERQIERLVIEAFQPGKGVQETQVPKDIEDLKGVTAQVKSIRKQGVLLIGECVYKAREILRYYGDGRGAFTNWLKMAFGSRSTGYNALSYFEFYKSLPTDALRSRFKQMPYKAAYLLAAREGDIRVKAEILEEHAQQKAEDILPIIQELLPSQEKTRAKDANSSLIDKITTCLNTLTRRKSSLTEENKRRIVALGEQLQALLAFDKSLNKVSMED